MNLFWSNTMNRQWACLWRGWCWVLLCMVGVAGAQDAGVKPAADDAVKDVFTSTGAAESVLEGYLAQRMRINVEKRLLSIRLEDILKPFVQRPGAQEWVGEHVGKFLHAASLEWERTRDPRIRARMDLAVQTLVAAQSPDGYLGTYLDKDRWTKWDVWSHKYNLIGLLEYHRVTGNRRALDSCRRIGDLLCDTFGDGKRDIIRSGTHVGMAPTSVLEPMVMLHRQTGEKRYLAFCDYLVRSWDQPHGPKILSSLLTHGSVRRTANNKSYEMMSNLVGLLDLYRMTGRREYLQATVQAWKDIRANQNYATGTSSWAEHFQDDGQLNPHGGMHGTKYVAAGEGCVTVTWMQMNWHLLRLTGEAAYAEELERSIYNALLAAQSPAEGTIGYFLPMLGRKRHGEIHHGIRPDICCCSSSIPRGIAMIRDLSAGTIDGNPAVLLYAPGEHVVQSGDGNRVVLRINTDYPKSGAVNIAVTPARNGSFTLLLRVPAWCGRFTAQVGEETHSGKPGQFLPIRRDWSGGDQVRVVMDMPTIAVPQGRPQDGWVAIQRGPQVLALDQAVAQAGVLPADWIGDDLYKVSGVQDGQPRQLPLVPVAEAGQSKTEYEAVFQRFSLADVAPPADAAPPAAAVPAARTLDEYRTELDAFRQEFGGVRALPDVPFFLFGMGPRAKLLYKSGTLIDPATGKTLRQWPVRDEIILPPDYAVFITTADGKSIRIFEDELAVWIEENGQLQAIEGTRKPVCLPSFDEYRFPRIMRVLHQELLVNVIDGKPVPNHFVYSKPWYRDAAMMAMCFKATGNLDTIKDWVMGLSEPFDRNNRGESEADNPGQALYLISLVGDRHHPLVPALLKALQRFEVEGPDGKFIKGRSDFAEHPVYQTKWAKYGLAALGLEDPYTVPRMPDSYSVLFWWAYKDTYIKGKDAHNRGDYPYLGWACDHFHGTKISPISNRDYPLTWEQRASQARYEGTRIVSEEYTAQKIAAPHTWHAAEVFLYLLEQKKPSGESMTTASEEGPPLFPALRSGARAMSGAACEKSRENEIPSSRPILWKRGQP